MYAPTLLIGLGGVGTKVVDRIYGRIPQNRRDRIAVHAFDTDVNDILQTDHLRNRITQTSTDWKVRQYLAHSDESVQDWFPDLQENRELGNKNLTDGAGQIRVVSRLAYRSAMEAGKLSRLEGQIRTVFRERGDDLVSSVRVMIVNSIAGGTGAGIFLQVALYVKNLLADSFGQENVLVRGAFVLPDVFLHTDLVDSQKSENLRANAYACMKELEGITQDPTSIDLEYAPGQTDRLGNPSITLEETDLPFDFCFLYDDRNVAGQNLGAYENYVDQVIDSLYLQLFTPIGSENFSVEDNEILNLIATSGRARYCGAGVASLVYPHEDIIDYCALQWATDSLSDQWLKPDEEFRREREMYEKDLQQGVVREEPELVDRYTKIVDNFAQGEDADPFFKQIYRSVHLKDDRQRLRETKARRFIQEIENEVENMVDADEDVSQLARKSEVEPKRLKDRDLALNHVENVEIELERLREAVYTAVEENKTYLINEVLRRDFDEPSAAGGQDHRLNTWVLGKVENEDVLHPVAVRYFLYQVYDLLGEELDALASENEDLKRRIDQYDERFDDPDTDRVESPEDILRSVLDEGFFESLFASDFDDFVERYEYEASHQRHQLLQYFERRLTERVFSAVRSGIRSMLDDWERFFHNLRSVRNRLKREGNERGKEHEEHGDPTVQYVLANEATKKERWEDIRLGFTTNQLPNDIARELYLGQYGRYCRRERGDGVEEQRTETTEEQFREDVLTWCKRELRGLDSLKLNVIQALEHEARREGEGRDYVEDMLGVASNLARPLVTKKIDASTIEFWGFHPDAIDEFQDSERQDWLEGNEVVDEAFSPFEVKCYRARYGYTARDFDKFESGRGDGAGEAGPYYLAYRNRIEKLVGIDGDAAQTVTPHLDRRWHLPTHLPDEINPEVSEKLHEDIYGAMIRGLAHEIIQPAERDMQRVWLVEAGDELEELDILGESVGGELHELHEGLLHNPHFVNAILEKADDRREEDVEDYPVTDDSLISQHQFHGGCSHVPGLEEDRNMLDFLLTYAVEAPGRNEIEERAMDLLDRFTAEVTDYYRDAYGEQRTQMADDRAANLIERLWNESEVYDEERDRSALKKKWDNLLESRLDELRS